MARKKNTEVCIDDEVENGGNSESQLNEKQAVGNDQLGLSNRKRSRHKKPKEILLWNIWEEEHERWIDENLIGDVALENPNEMGTATVEAPPDLISDLLRYQKEWLAWALKQEDSVYKGGILADEMGMGKTLQAIALVLAKRERCRSMGEPFGSSASSISSKVLPEIKGTLVVCPVVAVSQWVSEIDRFTSKGSTRVLVYHGANREKSFEQFSNYDFIITTYSIVEIDYRKYIMPPKQRCPSCGKFLYENKMKMHTRFFCGPLSVRTEKQSKQQRKKSDLTTTSSKQDSKYSKEKKRKKKEVDGETMLDIENYSGDPQGSSRGKSILHSVKWNRVILDEVS